MISGKAVPRRSENSSKGAAVKEAAATGARAAVNGAAVVRKAAETDKVEPAATKGAAVATQAAVNRTIP